MVETRELNQGSGEVDAVNVTLGYPNGSTKRDIGDPVTVTVVTHYHWMSFWKVTLPFATTTIKGSATMRLERDETTNNALVAGSGNCPNGG